MSIDKNQLKDLIERVLKQIPKFYSEDAVTLLMMTAATESDLGLWLRQKGGGPGRGIMQVEISTMKDNYNNYLMFRSSLSNDIETVTGVKYPREDLLEFNMAFNIIMARLKYFRVPKPIPSDLEGMAKYHEKYYNAGGAADWVVTVDKYKHFCLK